MNYLDVKTLLYVWNDCNGTLDNMVYLSYFSFDYIDSDANKDTWLLQDI